MNTQPPTTSRKLHGLLRVAGLWSICGAVALGLCTRAAMAQLGEGVSDIGQQMLAWYGGKTSDAPRRLVVNGLSLSLVSAVTDASIHEVFDHFAAECQKRAGVIAAGKPNKLLEAVTDDDFKNIQQGIVRRESDREGTIVCIDTDRPLDARELLERVKRYNQSHDLADIGRLRALTARRGSKKTQLLMMGATGEMKMDRAFPKTGDAPGVEPAGVPRPPESRRLFNATEEAGQNAIHVYESPGGQPAVVLAFYRTELEKRGFRVTNGGQPGALLAQRGDRNLMIVSSEKGENTLRTSLLELSK